MIRHATLARPRTTLPNASTQNISPSQNVAVARQALDSFEGPTSVASPTNGLNIGGSTSPTSPTTALTNNPTAPSTPAQSSSSSIGSFFSNLFSGILGGLKSLASSVLGQVGSYVDNSVGSWLSSSTNNGSSSSSGIGSLFGGLVTQAKSWFDGVISNLTNKLSS